MDGQDLISKGILVQEGAGRGTSYNPNREILLTGKS
jgi:hypothetical protein